MPDKIFLKLKEALPNIRKNVSLKDYGTYKIGGPAKYFFVAKSKNELIRALKTAKKFKMPFFILSGGSNILFSDKGFLGLVIKIENGEAVISRNNLISAGAGAELSKLVWLSAGKSLKGLEWAGGLPGTLGGAIRGNAGAFGGEIKDVVLKVEALDGNAHLREFSNKKCQFSYRSSIFKKKGWVVVSATLKLERGNKKDIEKIARSRVNYRKERHPLEYPNIGSIFKNCPFSDFSGKHKKELLKIVKKDPFPVVPTAYLISECGLKNKRIGGAKISEKHPNFIVNLGNAKAKDVLKLIRIVKKKVKNKFKVNLETEAQLIGF